MKKPEISDYIKKDPSELSNAEILVGYQNYAKALDKYIEQMNSSNYLCIHCDFNDYIMRKITDIFDRLNNTIGNHMEGKATDKDLINMVYEIDKYLLENPHPHDLVKNHGVSHHVIDTKPVHSCIECLGEITSDNGSGKCSICR